MSDYTISIIGSGPAGLACAFYLKDNLGDDIRSGKIKICIIEKTNYCSGGLINDGKMNLTPYIGFDDFKEHTSFLLWDFTE